MGKNIWLLRQDLAVILFMWHYILYLEFHINCSGLIEGIEHPGFVVKVFVFSIFITNKNGKIACLVLNFLIKKKIKLLWEEVLD